MNNQTPAHLAPLETAARIFCAKIGVDPDEQVRMPHPLIRGATIGTPFWHGPAEEMLHLSAMLASFKEAADMTPKVVMQ